MANGWGGARQGSGPKRPQKARDELKALIDDLWTDEKQKLCIEQWIKDATDPDFNIRQESRKLLFGYRFGKPTEKIEMNGTVEHKTVTEMTDEELYRIAAGGSPGGGEEEGGA